MKRTFNLFSLAMILALIASLLGMPPIPAYAESTIENVPLSLPAGWREGHLYDVWSSSPRDVYAVGYAIDAIGNHVPLVYHNDGTAWTEASPPLATGWGGGHLYGVWGSGVGDVYAVGEGYNQNGAGSLLYHNDGTGWTEATPSLPTGWSGGSLIDVWGSSASDVYAVGWSSNGPLIYHNDGTGWSDASSSLSSGGYLNGVWGSSASDVYAVGTGTNVPLVYHNDGTDWTEASPSLPVGWSYGNLRSVWGSSASDIYAVGWGSNGSLLYHNNGTGWSDASSLLPAGGGYLFGVWGSSASNVYAVGYGDNAVGDTSPLIYHNDGTGWSDASSLLPLGWSAGYLHSVWGSSAGDLYVVGEGSYVFNNGTVPLLYQRGADTLIVTNTNDSGIGSLRQAIADAVPGGIIVFDPSLAGQTLTLGLNLIINKDLIIDGSGLASQVIISGGNIAHLEVVSGAMVTISDLTITKGNYGILSRGDLRIINSTLKDNFNYSGGAVSSYDGSLTIKNSTITQNYSYYGGGAISIGGVGTARIINSTVVGNQAVYYGGGISMSGNVAVDIINSTFAGNSAPQGSEISISGSTSTLAISNSVFACTQTNSICYDYLPSSVASTNSIIGVGTLADFGLADLANNGGPTQTMALLPGSSLIDAGNATNCPPTDQRGVTRPQGAACDIGAFEYVAPPTPTPTYTPTFTPTFNPTSTPTDTPTYTPTATPTNTFTPTATPPYSYNPLYLSLTGNQTVGGITSADEDILRFDGSAWSLLFDGSDVGVASPDLFGFSMLDSDSILMSFSSAVTVNGLAVSPQDVVRFDATSLGSNTAGTFSMYLDGSDVGLDTTAEKIDSVTLLPDGRVLISTTGNPVVVGITGGKDEDVLAFTPISLEDVTSGSWAMYFDGSDVGLAETSGEDVDALDAVGGKIYLSTADSFSVNGAAGADEDVFVCEPISLGDVTACNYSPSLYFDGSTWGLSANDVDAFHFLSLGPVPTSTPTVIPSNTPTNTPTGTPTRTSTPTITLTATITPALPRGVFDVRILSHQPSPSNIGEAVTFTVSVTDFGGGPAGSVTVNIVSDEGSTSCTTSETSTTCSAQLTFYNPSGHLITASVGGDMAQVDHYVYPPATHTSTPTNTPTVADLIFVDDFESGNLAAWTSSTVDLGDLSVSNAAALTGNRGLQAAIDDATAIYLTDDSPTAEPRYRARFYFDPNSIAMTSGEAHYIFKGFAGNSTEVLRVEFRNSSGSYQMRAALVNDGTTWTNTNWFTISDASHFIELDWRAATAAGANNGGLTFWIDSTQQVDLNGIDNDTRRIDRVRLGALTGIDIGTRGTYYFDTFESRRQSYIGP